MAQLGIIATVIRLKEKKIGIIGAGIVGVMCACFLKREGYDVTLFDHQRPGSATSFGNSGIISPGAVVPIAMPGIIKNIPNWLFKSDAPLSMQWTSLPEYLPWMIRFLINSQESLARNNSSALSALNSESLDLLKPLLTEANLNNLVEQKGMLYVYKTEQEYQSDKLAIELRENTRFTCNHISGTELRELEPNISKQFSKGVFFPEVNHTLNPYKLVEQLTAYFLQLGGSYLSKKIVDITTTNEGRAQLTTDSQIIEQDLCVITAGIWSKKLVKRLGYKVPMVSHRGYHITVNDPAINLNTVICPSGYMATIVPMEMGIRIGGTVELTNMGKGFNHKRIRALLNNLKNTLPLINTDKMTTWMGDRPCTPDSLPIICRAPTHRSFLFAFGHGHQGVLSAPKTAQIITDLVIERKPRINMNLFDIQRFT